MKKDSIQELLAKYSEGTLTEGERADLERLAHKDEVLASANRRATAIVRRRVSVAASVLILSVAGVWALMPGQSEQMPLVAQADVEQQTESPAVVPETVVPEALPAAVEPQPLVAEARPAAARRPKAQTAPVLPPEEVVAPVLEQPQDPVVMCNSQCDADSVISDIKKFLSV